MNMKYTPGPWYGGHPDWKGFGKTPLSPKQQELRTHDLIKQLAKQSGAWHYYEINEGVDGDEKPLEKFYELIVEEAINVVSKRHMGDNNREDAEVLLCVKDLKKHFGVEE